MKKATNNTVFSEGESINHYLKKNSFVKTRFDEFCLLLADFKETYPWNNQVKVRYTRQGVFHSKNEVDYIRPRDVKFICSK